MTTTCLNFAEKILKISNFYALKLMLFRIIFPSEKIYKFVPNFLYTTLRKIFKNFKLLLIIIKAIYKKNFL